jgi:hypothetical protein
VLWARQLAVIGVGVGFEAHDETPMVLAAAGVTLAVLAAALALHCRVQPYAHGYQNKAEIVLACFSMLAVVIGCVVYWHRAELTQVSANVFGAALAGMLLGPAFLYGIWLCADGRRRVIKPSTDLGESLLQRGVDGAPLSSLSINAGEHVESDSSARQLGTVPAENASNDDCERSEGSNDGCEYAEGSNNGCEHADSDSMPPC